jgi:hypothetical protein
MNNKKPEHAWDNPDIPHKGWQEDYVEDLESPEHTCEMCGKTDIRYVHTMSHPEYPTTLDVGCECAIKMTNDYVGPKETKREAKNLSNNKQSWFANSHWEDYEKSNYTAACSYRMSRTITAVVKETKNNIWTWSVSADRSDSKTGFAYNRSNAKQRAEQHIKTMQTPKG